MSQVGYNEEPNEDSIRNVLMAKYPNLAVLLKQGKEGSSLLTKAATI